MKTIKTLAPVLLMFIASASFAQTAKDVQIKLFEKIAGHWQIQKVFDGTKDITPSSSELGQQLEFGLEGHYKMSSGTQRLDSGSYRISENHKLLYLESRNNSVTANAPANQSTWLIDIKNETLTMTGQGNSKSKKIKYVYVRSREELSK